MTVAVVVPRPPGYVHAAALLDLAEPLCGGLKENGLDARITEEPSENERVVVVGPHLLDKMPPEGAILYNTEQVSEESTWFKGPLLELYKNHRVWDYDPVNTVALKALGVDAVTVPPGYYFGMEHVKRSGVEQSIDVLFFGSMNMRRELILRDLGERGVRVVHAFSLYGIERDKAVAQSKIVLNTHYYEASIFEAARVSYLLANRAFVVSEKSEYMPWQGGYVAAPYDQLVKTCFDALDMPETRKFLAERGFETFSKHTAADAVRSVAAELLD